MKRYSKSKCDNIINITMYLHPIIYENSEMLIDHISAAVTFNRAKNRYHTDINPSRIINGPLSDYGQELEPPIKDEWESLITDCKWLVRELEFVEITSSRSTESGKSEYVSVFGLDGNECGTLVFDLRLSDHPFDADFPDDYKDIAVEYLTMHNILGGNATKAGIDFSVEQIIVGSVKNDTWDRALERLYLLLRRLKRKIRHRLNEGRG